MTNGFSSTFNGGGGCSNNCSGAGGATDVRLVGGSWNDPTGLKSRIMVAAGGGGYNSYQSKYPGGPGGTLIGISGSGDSPRTGGSQTTGGVGNAASRNGSFGIGGYGDNWGGGGGGGYWGGAGGNNSSTGNGGSSGSSFISGHLGCVAILSDSSLSPRNDSNEVACADGTTDITCSYHYSGKIFTNTVMIAGNQSMPTHDGSSTVTGNKDNGYAKITLGG